MLHSGRARVRFPVRSLDFSVDLDLPAYLWPRGLQKILVELICDWLIEMTQDSCHEYGMSTKHRTSCALNATARCHVVSSSDKYQGRIDCVM
jgi:hypothetical protein